MQTPLKRKVCRFKNFNLKSVILVLGRTTVSRSDVCTQGTPAVCPNFTCLCESRSAGPNWHPNMKVKNLEPLVEKEGRMNMKC